MNDLLTEELLKALDFLDNGKCQKQSIEIFKALVHLSQGLTKNVAMLVPIRVALDSHDYLSHCHRVEEVIPKLPGKFIFYHHGVVNKHFAVVGFGTKIYEHVSKIEEAAMSTWGIIKGDDGFTSLPYTIVVISDKDKV